MEKKINDITDALTDHYNLNIRSVLLVREMIGLVYLVECENDKYIFKLYREDTKIDVVSKTRIMNHLYSDGVKLPKIFVTNTKACYIKINHGIGVLFEYIDGDKLVGGDKDNLVLKEFTKMNSSIDNYNGKIVSAKKEFLIERYIKHLINIKYDKNKVDRLKNITYKLYESTQTLAQGFCHGDFHSENMIYKNGHIYLLDFDACRLQSSCIDLLVYFDKTNFNHYRYEDMVGTAKVLRDLGCLNSIDLKALMAFLPVRHCEIISTIIEAKGSKDISLSFYDQQFEWISNYYNDWLEWKDEKPWG
jgi:Ser/Thr protein kinase RdoA (MazF antagonist)